MERNSFYSKCYCFIQLGDAFKIFWPCFILPFLKIIVKKKSFLSNRKIHLLYEKDFVKLWGTSFKISFFHEANTTLQMLQY